MNIINKIFSAGPEYSPVPFWFFNDTFDKEKIKNMLKDYTEKGVNAFVLHPRIGVPESMEYLSEEYFDAVEYIVDTAAKLDMHVVLYDEGMYPSGSAHGLVVKENPSYASVGIIIKDSAAAGKVIAKLDDGRYIIEEKSHGTIRGIHFGEDDNEAGAPASADILNPDAVDCFIRLTHEQYYSRLKKYFGNVIIGFFTDEPCILGRNAGAYREWTPGIEAEITAEGGNLKELEGLFTGDENRTVRIYRRCIKNRLMKVFYTKLSEWCVSHDIAFMGHPAESDDCDEELYFQIPGQDLIMRRESPEEGGIIQPDSVHAKCASDIAQLLGRRRNANECFGVCCRDNIPWYFTASDMKWYIDWLGIRGVNMYIPHAFYYSTAGERKGERPPDVGPNNIWWPYYRQFSDYMKSISYIMTDSERVCHTAVLCRSNHLPYKEMIPFFETQKAFTYLPVSLLEDSRIENGVLYAGKMKFDSVYNLAGEEYNYRLDNIKQISDAQEAEGDISVQPSCRGLRAVHVVKDGSDMYMLFLEEGEAAEFTLTVKQPEGFFVCVDLWKRKSYRCSYTKNEDSASIKLSMKRGETKLIVITDEETFLNTACEEERTYLGNITDRLELVNSKENVKEYVFRTDIAEPLGNEYFDFTGEEMAECWCNGSFVGADFFTEHEFAVGKYLLSGKNEIKIRMTGNAANVYTSAEIPFGVMRE